MKTLISIMMVWISINTGFVVPDAPSIGYLSPFEIKRYAYGCDEKPVPIGNEDICDNNVVVAGTPKALYDHTKSTILVASGFTSDTILNQSILLHELIHHRHPE